MKRLSFAILILCVAQLISANGARAEILIDDFEAVSFSQSHSFPGCGQFTVPVAQYWHCISTNRDINICPNGGGSISTVLNTGELPNDGLVVNMNGGGSVLMLYWWGYEMDLTEGGTVDRLIVHMPTATAIGGNLILRVDGPNETSTYDTLSVGGPGTYEFELADLAPLAAHATSILVKCSASDDAYMFITDIRTFRSDSGGTNLAGDFVFTQWPPLPASPLPYRTFDLVGQSLYSTSFTVQSCENGGLPQPAMSANIAEGPFYNGEAAFMEVWWNDYETGLDQTMFTLSFDYGSVPGASPEIADFPYVAYSGDEGFSISTGLLVRDASSAPMGDSHSSIVFSRGRFQDFTFADVMVEPHASKSAASTGFDVSFRLDGSNVEQVEPLFEIVVVSDWSTGIATGIAGAIPLGADGPGLLAAPNVTAGGTELRLSRPPADPTTIEIYDVRGRLVRTLDAPGGTRAVRWEGRDAASGIYWAKVAGRPGKAARIVLVR